MRKIYSLIIFLPAVLLLPNRLFSQSDTVLLFHPTVENIKSIDFIFREVIRVENPDQFHFLGVYHKRESYDYSRSELFLSEPGNEDLPFSLWEISVEADPKDLYMQNCYTDIFVELFNLSVGAVFMGGPDMPPSLYGESMNLLTEVTDPWRHYMEISAMYNLLGSSRNPAQLPLLDSDENYVILAICLGMQTMNVATGGTLYQDIPTELYAHSTREAAISDPGHLHRNYYFDDPSDSIYFTSYHFHPLMTDKKSSLAKALGLKKDYFPQVLSSHHQAVKTLGKGLVPIGWSMDGTITEVLVHEKYPSVLAVQFHPEKTGLYKDFSKQNVNADSIINFNSYVRETESYEFHTKFWENFGELLKLNKQ